jgi:hypothetical protein
MTSKKIFAHLFILVLAVFALLVASCSDMGKYPATVANQPPVITSSSSTNAIENVRFIYRASAYDPDGTAPSISYDSYPAWLSVTGDAISGTAEVGSPDTSFRVTASDGLLLVSLTVSVTVQDTASATETRLFTYHATAQDPDGTTPVISFEDYASWLNPLGDSISGTPAAGAADTTLTVIASDGLLSDTLIVSLTIISGPALVSYAAQVQPVFTANCAISGCHGMGMNPPAGLRLMSYQMLMDTTSHRAVIIPFQPDSSILVMRIEGTITPRMPRNGPPYLPDSTIQTIRTWVAQGALDN